MRAVARAAILVLVLSASLARAAEVGEVTRVVDGDTIKVQIGRKTETVRLIGVDTPESVHPERPVEYFAKEASAFTKRMALGQRVRLEDDAECTNRDKYQRLLRYVYLPNGKLLNGEIIRQGYGFAYTKYPFSRMDEFRKLERKAREKGRGLWAE